MRTKKLLSAMLAGTVSAASLISPAAFTALAADDTALTFDIRSDGTNAVTVTAEEIAAGDVSVPVQIYIPSNPGINAANLKFQINDGEIDADGRFGNYGLYFSEAAIASPYCFGSEEAGESGTAFSHQFNAEMMNLSWVYSQDVSVNADAAAEAGTYSWDSTVSWAYDTAFATASLVIPKDTPAGTYTLDIRTEQYVNSLSIGSDNVKYSVSSVKSADQTDAVSFQSVPLTITVGDATVSDEPWVDDYTIPDGGLYYIISDASAKPGSTVYVPVYIYGDPGTAGMRIFFEVEGDATLTGLMVRRGCAYDISPSTNTDITPASFVFASSQNLVAEDGSALVYLRIVVPEDATAGTTYPLRFSAQGLIEGVPVDAQVGNRDMEELDVTYYNGSLTVVTDDTTPVLNYTEYTLDEAGETVNLTIFNATGNVTWTSSDEAVATVDQNGFVTATGNGTATITAKANGTDYTAKITVGSSAGSGLFGDVTQNGVVDTNDAQSALQAYVNAQANLPAGLTDEQMEIADVDANGVVNTADAQDILEYVVNEKAAMGITWYEITGNPKAPGGPEAEA